MQTTIMLAWRGVQTKDMVAPFFTANWLLISLMLDPHSCHRYLRHNIVDLIRGQLITADVIETEQ